MNTRWISSSVAVGTLLLAAPVMLVARDLKTPNPCRELKTDLDNQVNSLHKRQDSELSQCRQTNGKNAATCHDLKNQQHLELSQLRDDRKTELNRCNPGTNLGSSRYQYSSIRP